MRGLTGLLGLTVCGLLTGCVSTAGTPVQPVPATATPADREMLTRWSQWNLSGLTQAGYPELPHRDHCAPDPQSATWFLDAPSTPGHEARACVIPAGHALLVIPAAIMGADERSCDLTVGTLTSAVLVNDLPSQVRPIGRVAALPASAAAKLDTPGYLCGSFTIISPLPVGQHHIVLQQSSTAVPDLTSEVDFTITVT